MSLNNTTSPKWKKTINITFYWRRIKEMALTAREWLLLLKEEQKEFNKKAESIFKKMHEEAEKNLVKELDVIL